MRIFYNVSTYAQSWYLVHVRSDLVTPNKHTTSQHRLEWGVTITTIPQGPHSLQVDAVGAGLMKCYVSSSESSRKVCRSVAGPFTVNSVANSLAEQKSAVGSTVSK